MVLAGWVLVMVVVNTGCVVMPARYATDKEGRTVMVEPERVVPISPIVVTAYPSPVVVRTYPEYYPEPVYYPAPVVMYDRPYYPYYRSRYIHYGRPVHHVRTVHIGGERHYRGHGRHSHRHR